jgi:hypothetical protein
MLTNVKYTLYFYERCGDGVCNIQLLPPAKEPLVIINRYSSKDENSEYAVRLSYEIDDSIYIQNGWLEFSIHANHGFSNTTVCERKRFETTDISTGIFETGESMRILTVTQKNTQETQKTESRIINKNE